MKNFKPSELPVGVVIEDETEGHYTKELDRTGNAFWAPTTYHCVDCADSYTVTNDNADEFFKNFHITCVPWETAFELALKLQDEYGTVDSEGETITIEGLIKDALDETHDNQQEEWKKHNAKLEWKVLDSFEKQYIEVNESGQFRCNDRIFNPEWDDKNEQWIVNVIDEDGEEHPLDPRYFVKQQFNKDYI